jgi:hypothetical protein
MHKIKLSNLISKNSLCMEQWVSLVTNLPWPCISYKVLHDLDFVLPALFQFAPHCVHHAKPYILQNFTFSFPNLWVFHVLTFDPNMASFCVLYCFSLPWIIPLPTPRTSFFSLHHCHPQTFVICLLF